MIGRAVIGANYGDEGKGLVTDYLANQGGDVVVRFNGGCQAGHTVVTPDGKRHVFSHFGSGTFLGLPTFLSQFCIVNPALFKKELAELETLGYRPKVYVDPRCAVTTPFDMDMNQRIESERGDERHGSCGVGIFETIRRHQHRPLTMRHLWRDMNIQGRVESIIDYYKIPATNDAHAMMGHFLNDAKFFAEYVQGCNYTTKWKDPIFEGAQGLLLSQDNVDDMPYLTPSFCGMRNVRHLAYKMDCKVEPYYVSRTYLTRHGPGPLAHEYGALTHPDDTNNDNPWQGKLRFAPLFYETLSERIHRDSSNPKLVLTHCDQQEAYEKSDLKTHGPTREDVVIGMRPMRQAGSG